ncbi:MAG: ComF family protein [Burkholderiales bacterium]|nr:ComF family protein [Burkholderiales bacterium]
MRPPRLAATLAAFAYAYPLDRLLHALKYRGAVAYAEFFASALAAIVTRTPDLLVALPLSASRQRERGFNQAQEIARALAAALRVPLVQGLVRRRDTAAQAALPWAQRRRNVRGAFAALPVVAGRRIAIVDDVMTTGATLAAAADAALRAGALEVEALVVARTLPPS